MALHQTSNTDQRVLPSGDEVGTAPGDRRFRPDVEGLRAVAILLVVLYHANVPRLTGGYVGVDVFFVISGFVITGLLLRERTGTGTTSIRDFYARRCRRILPAATLVILVTVLTTYVVLGVVTGNNTAVDGRWAAVFLANFHFEAVGTNYLSALHPPSPLQNYWSLSVEEQFYIVYPTLFLLVAGLRVGRSLRARMAVMLCLIIVGSYGLSIIQTASHPAAAYFSPFARAWELALGALVAVATSWMKRVPGSIAAALTWVGLGAVLSAAFVFNAQTDYPGSLVAIPVVGAALIIAGGTAVPRLGVETLLGLRPFRGLGKVSYSLYLWHWPILIIAAERVGEPNLPVGESLLLVLVALALSVVTYLVVENPVRHWRLPSNSSIGLGLGLVLTALTVLSLALAVGESSSPSYRVVPAANVQIVRQQVAAAARIVTVPPTLEPSVAQAPEDWGGNHERAACEASLTESTERICTLGDTRAKPLMIVYGDSHALMWLQAFKDIAEAAHWRLVVLAKPDCPAGILTVQNPSGVGSNGGSYDACTKWHQWSVREINQLDPALLVISQDSIYSTPVRAGSPTRTFTPSEWKRGVVRFLDEVDNPHTEKVILGNIPQLPEAAPECLAAHADDVQSCSAPLRSTRVPLSPAERSAAAQLEIGYIDPTPWFCSAVCTPIVSHYTVYMDRFHVTTTYAEYLEIVLGRALGFRMGSV